MRKEVEGLEHHRRPAAYLAQSCPVPARKTPILWRVDADPRHFDAAALRDLEKVDGAEHRGLAGARRPHHDHDLARRDGKIEVAQDLQRAEGFADLGEPDDRAHQRCLDRRASTPSCASVRI